MGSPHNSHRSSAPDCSVRNSISGPSNRGWDEREHAIRSPSLSFAALVAITDLPQYRDQNREEEAAGLTLGHVQAGFLTKNRALPLVGNLAAIV